jgi:hypothetical protein
VFLINNSSVEAYVNQSRSQAEASFLLSRRVAIAGFTLLVASIGFGLVSELTANSLSVAYLAGISGVVTEFIAGVFFWIYNRTLQQINLFYEGMMTQQQDALAAIGRSSESAAEAAKGRLLGAMIKAEKDTLEDRDTDESSHPGVGEDREPDHRGVGDGGDPFSGG